MCVGLPSYLTPENAYLPRGWVNSIGCPYRYSVGRAPGGERFSSSRGGRRHPGTQALTFALTAARLVAIVVLCIFIWPDMCSGLW